MNKQRPAIRNLLKGNPNVFHYTSFETANQLFSVHPIWQHVRIEAERRQLFREYVTELQQRDQVRTTHTFLCYAAASYVLVY